MAIFVDSDIEITLRQSWYGQQINNVWHYNIMGAPGGVGVSAAELAQAWWNHVKSAYRAICPSDQGNCFNTVLLRVVNNPAGDYGEYSIPVGEQAGTRTPGTQNQGQPPFNAASVRLVVGTRVTRPGQKRFAFLNEGDNNNGGLQSSYTTPLTALMTVMVAQMTLGAPAALFVLRPEVFRLTSTDLLLASQPITGYVINPNISSQVSRKYGRGS